MTMLIFSLYTWALSISSFYSLQFQDVDGNTINMSNFQGKKVLIANIATDCNRVGQLQGLQQLQQQYHDSLVVIVFPSNSFNHESRSDADIKTFCQAGYQSTFIIAAKSPVTGSGVNPVFIWLSSATENGNLDAPPSGDYQKYLISRTGNLVSVLSPKLNPTDPDVIEAITSNF